MKALRRMPLALLTGAALVAAGCGGGGGSTNAGSGSASGGAKTIKVGMFTVGPKNDKSFDQGAYEGALDVGKTHPNVKLTAVLENKAGTNQDAVDAVNTLAPNNDIVIGVGGVSGPVIGQLAAKFPKTTFLTIQGTNPPHYNKNVYSLVWDALEPYVSGAVAAKLTKSDVVGFIGGAEIPSTVKSEQAFVAAVTAGNPKVKVLKNIIGDFNDVSGAKAATSAMLADRADVIYPFLDAGIVGSYAAAQSKHQLVPLFKIDFPDCKTYPNMVGTSLLEDTRAGTRQLLNGFVSGSLKPAGVVVFAGLQDPALQRMVLCPKYQKNQTVVKTVNDVTNGIRSGKIKVPNEILFPRPNYPWKDGFAGAVHNAGQTG